MKRAIAPLGLVPLLLAAGCVESHFNLATQKQDYSFTSDTREVSVGRKIAAKVEKENPPVADAALQEKVDAMGQKLAAVSDRKDLVYHFAVIDDPKSDEDIVNAFSLPGGYVFLYNDLVKKTTSDDELAGVIAHEIAHIAARHSVQRQESGIGASLAQIAAIVTRNGPAATGLNVALQATMLAHAREDELQADKLGVKYMKEAGFNPEGMLSFLRTMQEVHKSESTYLPRGVVKPSYAYTHPGVPERIASIKEELYGVADYIDYLNVPR